MQPQVSSANVNLATETAIVWAISEAKVMTNWKQQLGNRLAGHLTTCGFKSSLRGTYLLTVMALYYGSCVGLDLIDVGVDDGNLILLLHPT